MTNLDNQEYITLIESISNRGKIIPPMIILYNILILEKWAKENNLDKNILLVTSSTGYSNDKLVLQWLKHFEIQSKISNEGLETIDIK